MNTFFVLLGIAGYFFVGGVIGKVHLDHVRSTCHRWQEEQRRKKQGLPRPEYSFERCEGDDHPLPFLTALFWPVALPVIAGVWVGKFLSPEQSEARASRAEKAHKRKMAEIAAQKDLHETAMKLLDREGVRHRVEMN